MIQRDREAGKIQQQRESQRFFITIPPSLCGGRIVAAPLLRIHTHTPRYLASASFLPAAPGVRAARVAMGSERLPSRSTGHNTEQPRAWENQFPLCRLARWLFGVAVLLSVRGSTERARVIIFGPGEKMLAAASCIDVSLKLSL